MKKIVSLESGNGGLEMAQFLNSFTNKLYRGNNENGKNLWSNFSNDSATYKLPNKDILCFTTDSYTVSPYIFPGGNIGDLAVSGTINDLAVMGCEPIGLSLSLIIEEGFELDELNIILDTINRIANEFKVPIVTGDTKVVEKGSVDKIIINTSGVGIAKKILCDKILPGDKIILSGGIAEHGVALLSKRFDFETNIVTDSKPVLLEMREIRDKIKFAKDPTRGGIASILNEIADEYSLKIVIDEEKIPIKKEVKTATKLLGIDPYSLANEGRILIICDSKNAQSVLKDLKKFNTMAEIIGEVEKLDKVGNVILKTTLGSRLLSMPSGKIVPRIC